MNKVEVSVNDPATPMLNCHQGRIVAVDVEAGNSGYQEKSILQQLKDNDLY